MRYRERERGVEVRWKDGAHSGPPSAGSLHSRPYDLVARSGEGRPDDACPDEYRQCEVGRDSEGVEEVMNVHGFG